MEAIKKTKQYKFKGLVIACTCTEKFDVEPQDCIVCKEIELQKVYDKYLSLLTQLDLTIKEYNLMQRKFEVELRKMQIKERKRIKEEVA